MAYQLKEGWLSSADMAAELGVERNSLIKSKHFQELGVHYELQPAIVRKQARRSWNREATLQKVAELNAPTGARADGHPDFTQRATARKPEPACDKRPVLLLDDWQAERCPDVHRPRMAHRCPPSVCRSTRAGGEPMNPALKGALAAALVVITGPIGLVAIGIYYLRKSREEQQKQTELLKQVVITPEQQ